MAMNKLASLSMLSLIFLFSLLPPSRGVQFCSQSLKLPGTCGPNATYDCFLAWNAKCGASAITHDCTCAPAAGNQHYCTCQVVCGQCLPANASNTTSTSAN
ncbi:hypothetical protein LOK49_LG06G02353 [Camellia lanceoleosa]|uniref:Uncharacterized protein n=1 Tax=Camellia lanceoleosa TaxID=1840588 RepID=A0ACC0HIM6_9ERIC|nr:hypothetical protein LOK49_LG06G02353 [Camellia lanceoleosa]